MSKRWAALLAVGVLLAVAGCASGDGGATGDGDTLDAAGGGGESAEDQAAEAGDTAAAAPEADDAAAEGGQAASAGGAGGGAAQPDPIAPLPDPPAAPGERVIKDGTVEVLVADDGVDQATERLIALVTRLQGSVTGATRRVTNEGASVGSLTVQVPVDAYEELVAGVANLGEIQRQNITSEDVGVEYVDLRSRLRNEEAQQRFYLELLEEAEDVQDAIAVQQRVEGIQAEIERLRGRLNYLDARTSYSTLTVEFREPSAPPLRAVDGPRTPSLARYWAQARAAFVNVVGSMLVVSFFLLPMLLPAAALLVAYVLWRRSVRRPTVHAPAE